MALALPCPTCVPDGSDIAEYMRVGLLQAAVWLQIILKEQHHPFRPTA